MRIGRKAAALALLAAASFAGSAQAGPIGSGTGTGIKDWLSLYQDLGNGHSARALCEYAVNPGPVGHFEAGANAFTGGSLSPSADAAKVAGTCDFYATSSGTLPLTDTQYSSRAAVDPYDRGARRPPLVCLTADVTWKNGDTIHFHKCQRARLFVQFEDVAVEIGPSTGTDRVIDTAGNGATGCANPAAALTRCANGAQEVVATVTAEDFQPGVDVSVSTGPGSS